MSNIHITLLGSQTAPVYLGIMAMNPDRVILICSEQTQNEAGLIFNEIRIECEIKKFDPVDLDKIDIAIVELKKTLNPTDLISINLVGGTKPWSLLFFAHFSTIENVTLIFIDQNNRVWDLKTRTYREVEFDMDVQFRLYGNKPKNFTEFAEFTDKDRNVVKQVREIRKFNHVDFISMTDYLSRYSHKTTAIGPGGSELEWVTVEKMIRVRMLNKSGKELNLTLKSEHVYKLVFNTGWFEYEVGSLLSQWGKTKQIRLNCTFPAKSGSPKNEIDIIVNTGTKLLFVECKTQIKNETDIDKFASAVRVYGGLGSKALFVTDAPMTDKAREKCADHKIMTFSLQDYLLKASAEKLLFEMLDRELFNINTK